ncbi:MAG: membrane dipeptidase [Gemmatimonadaceae bacterium]
MPIDDQISRRSFAKLAAAAAVIPGLPVMASPRSARSTTRWPGYERAVVIDMLATPGPFNVPDWLDRTLTDEMIENARASGITAVNVTVSALGDASTAFEKTVFNIAALEHECRRTPKVFSNVRSVADLRLAKEQRKVGIIYGFQDTTPLWDRPERVEMFHRLGVRIIQLTYNGPNLVGDGCLVPKDGGLKPYGRDIIGRMNDLGILVDVSHTGWDTTRQAIDASRKPVAATHSGAAAVTNNPRNKPDDILKKIASRGGVVGIFMMPFLRESGQPTAVDFVRHVTHCVNVCGEDHVGVGSDNSITPLDLSPDFRKMHADFVEARRKAGISAPGEDAQVFNYVPEFNSPRRMELVAEKLAAAGYTTRRIEKVIGGNWARVLGEVW